MSKTQEFPTSFPSQHQPVQPGIESLMEPRPIIESSSYKGARKLTDKVAIVTGGDSGIGAAVSIAFAKEGADVVIPYYSSYENEDAFRTKERIESFGSNCMLLTGDLKSEQNCKQVINETINHFGKLNILVNNHGVQFPQDHISDISTEQLLLTFQTNILSYFYLTKAAIPYLTKGDAIINTASIVTYEGNDKLLDYTATKGAVVGFTRALSQQLASDDIRVNAVAPGPIWTPLIPSSFSAEYIETTFGKTIPFKRAGQPVELAPAYVYLASSDSSYVSGQVIHVNGGAMVSS